MDGKHIENERRWLLKVTHGTHSDVDVARDFRVRFFKAHAVVRFRNQFARGQKNYREACGQSTIGRQTIGLSEKLRL